MADYRSIARQIARKYGIPENIFLSLIQHESGWNPNAKSPAGAIGLAQLMPGTAQGLGVNPRDPRQNLEGGAKYLSQQFKKFGNWRFALAAYNAGPGAVEKYKGIPPYSETQKYVRGVLSAAGKNRGTGGGTGAPGALGGLTDPSTGIQGSVLSSLGDIAAGEQYNPLKQLQEIASAPPEADVSSLEAPAPTQLKGGGGWGGSKGIADQLIRGLGLPVTSSKRDKKNTASGGVSDHWTGSKNAFAYDLGGSVQKMDRAAVALARRLGIKYRIGQPLVATVNRNGFRIQILYRTMTGGDHFDHVHVGIRRL